ncbi:fatty acid synthase-like [Zerene cesonia]|uniref:fatty acid synthase-like n=1 Tax=Zerene cesonia TaxID=33412 RepID=UPI0018E568FD|nr:fatty acid synthase-like [Zerene cesonia]
MAGLYPDSHNVKQLRDILYNKINPTKNARWEYNHPEVAHHTGKVPELQYFDAQFFKVHYRLGNSMDCMARKVLEQAFDAIYDAGVSPEQLYGSRIGVYVGTCFSETEKSCFYVSTSRSGFGIAGCSKTMFANRISYWLNGKGPSMSVDQACCSSTVALNLAYQAIMRGDVDSAIVGGANLCLLPQSSVHYGRVVPTSKDGKTKSFDKDASGCTRSEAINVLFLQKAKDALRIYAEVIHVKSEFNGLVEGENGPRYGFYRDQNKVEAFLKTFYAEANVPPQAVEYVEAVGSATPETDKAELETIDKVFCENRDDPLFVGSVMSNIGYGEAASGVSAITKVLLGYENGKLAANLNCENPRNDVDALRNGKIRIVTEHQSFGSGYVAVNGLSVTGVNTHVLLRGLNKPKDLNRYKSKIPHLVTISGRQQSGVEKILEDLKSRPIDPEELALFHNIHQTRISGHLGRGFIILDTGKNNETVSLCQKSDYFDDAVRPLWFVYSGMGSQWAGMGTDLMRIPVFAKAIERCQKVLEQKGLDLINIITSQDKKMFDNILHSFVGIAAIQIGLTDVLKALGIVPDKIIGHSVGELGCAYADGCLTAEEMILSAYSRGLVSVQTPFIRGSMAAVGIGYQQICKMCPPEIEVACHNSSESSTISGPADIMKEFVESLTAKGIFAREVPCSNIAYHSRYIADAGPSLLHYLNEVIKTPRLRTERWVSTSIPEERWGEQLAKYSSAEYHTNNLLNPVLFEESSQHIPKNAVLVEVAPHGLLQAILKRSLPNCTNIPLTRRGHADNAKHLLEAVGNLYMEGYNPKVHALYPKVEFPVSTGTPMLGHLVEWAHAEKWNLPMYVSAYKKMAASCNFVLSIHDDEHSYLRGHIIKGKNYYPFSAALVAVWDTLAMSLGMKKKSISVQFQDVQFLAQPLLHNRRQLRLSVALHKGTGKFEVTNEIIAVATGTIQMIEKGDNYRLFKLPIEHKEPPSLQSEDIYKLLYTRDYHYRDDFRSINAVNDSLTEASLYWRNNWVTLIDGMIQLNVLRESSTTVSQLDSMRKMNINIDIHRMHTDNKVLTANVLDLYECTRCGGVLIENLNFKSLPLNKSESVSIKHLKFVPHVTNNQLNETSALCVLLQIISENVQKNEINAIKMLNNSSYGGTFNLLNEFLHKRTGITVNLVEDEHTNSIKEESLLHNVDVIFVNDLSNNEKGRIMNLCIINNELDEDQFIEDLPESDLAINVWDHGIWGGKYVVPGNKTSHTGQCAMLQSLKIGDIESLRWFEVPKVSNSGINVQVHYAGINDQDVKRAFGLIPFGEHPTNSFYGMDYSGVTQNGTKVMGLIKGGSVSSQIKANPNLLWPVPEHWTLEDAATVPLAYCMAFYALNTQGTFSPGIKVLIHCGTGALGQAAISICLAYNCEVSWKCGGPYGVMVDTSLISNHEDYNFGMSYLTDERSFKMINFSSLFDSGNEQEMKKLQMQLAEGIARGYVRPLTRVVYTPDDVSKAFNLVATSRHRGRVLIDIQKEICIEVPRLNCSPNNAHIVLSDSDVLAMQLVDRLVDRGIRNLSVICEGRSESLLYKIRLWRKAGIEVKLQEFDDIWHKNRIFTVLQDYKENNVEGIYVIFTNDSKIDRVNKFLEDLDSKTRDLCPQIRYFAIISSNNMIGERVALLREKHGKPATLIRLPSLLKNGHEQQQMPIRSAIDAVEEALLSQEAVSETQLLPVSNKSLIGEITKWAGIKLPTVGDENLTLTDLGMDLARAQGVQAGFKNEYNISFLEDEISKLTIERIRKIEKLLLESEFKDATDLETFYSYIDPDELLATTEMAFLPTLTNNMSMQDHEFDSSQKFLCIIPGVEGHYKRFSEMCERLKLSALVLQPSQAMARNKTLQEVAQILAKTLLKQTELKDNFYLLGYESGAIVALEMAAILEEHGLTGKVYCIGGAPEEIQMQFASKLQEFKDETSLQKAVGRHMVKLMLGQNSASLDKAFEMALTWEDILDSCVRDLRGRVNHSAQYARELIETAYLRILQVRNYSPNLEKLRSQLILMKPNDWIAKFSSKSSLQDYSAQPIIEYELKAPLAYAVQDLLCAGIINRHLDEDVLEAFDNKNLCDTYLINADTFMTTVDG